MYLEDVGDGYLHIGPDHAAGDPRLAQPASSGGADGAPTPPSGQFEDSATGYSDLLLPWDADRAQGGAPDADQRYLPEIDAKLPDRKYDDSAIFKGTGNRLKVDEPGERIER